VQNWAGPAVFILENKLSKAVKRAAGDELHTRKLIVGVYGLLK